MTRCPKCSGLFIVEPLPVEVQACAEYSVELGWRRCLNCGLCLDLVMLRNKQERALARQIDLACQPPPQEETENAHQDEASCLIA
jgi:hypothetical protein